MGMRKGVLIGLFCVLLCSQFVNASNGCNAADLECGPIPTNNCDVRVNTSFAPDNYFMVHGIDICADNIVLNCQNSLLIASITNTNIGISVSQKNNIQILHCNVQNFSVGLDLSESYSSLLKDNRLQENIYNLRLQNSQYNVLENNTVSFNRPLEIGYGIILNNSAENSVVRNHAYSNEIGIGLFDLSHHNTLIGNNASNNSRAGVFIERSNQMQLFSNNMSRNNDNGIEIRFSQQNYLFNNTASYNKGSGYFHNGSTVFLEKNNFCRNGLFPPNFDIRIGYINYAAGASGVNNTCYRSFNYTDPGGMNYSHIAMVSCRFPCANPILPPALYGPFPDIVIEEDTNKTLDLYDYFYDPLGEVINFTFYAVNGSPIVQTTILDPFGIVILTPPTNYVGNQAFYIMANDTYRIGMYSNIFYINVTFGDDDSPVFVQLSDIEIRALGIVNIQLNATDPENSTVTYGTNAASILPSAFYFNETTGLFIWNTSVSDIGVYYVKFNASDGLLVSNRSLNISVLPSVNQNPVLVTPIPNIIWPEDTNISINLNSYFIDPDNQTMNYSASSISSIAVQINNITGVAAFSSPMNFFGTRTIIFTAREKHGLITNSNLVLLNVTNVNDPPSLLNPGNRVIDASNTLFIQLTGFDIENDTLIYGTNAASVLPTYSNLNSTSGQFTWLPTNNGIGNYIVTFSVTDGVNSQSVNVSILVLDPLIVGFNSVSGDSTQFDWSLSIAYYDGFNHRATLGLLAIPGLPQTDVELNYSFEFNDSISNHGWQSANPLSVFTSNNLSFEGNRSLKVISTVFQHDFNVVLSNQGRKSCMVWHDNGNNQTPSSYVGFDKVTTNTEGIFMGFQNNHPPCTSATYCIYSPSPQLWRNSNIIRNIGWHQFCMNAKTVGAPDFTWDTIRVLNNTGATDFDMISAWNDGATSHIDNVRLSSGYDPNKNYLRCKNLVTESAYSIINVTTAERLNQGSIAYRVSNDQGNHWIPIIPGMPVEFNQSSLSLTCDIRFTRGPDGNSTPELSYLRFDISSPSTIALNTPPVIGTNVTFSLESPLYPNASYIFGMALNNTTGIDLGDGRIIPLDNDLLLQFTLDPFIASTVVGLTNSQSTLNQNGQSNVTWSIPNIPEIANLTIYAGFAVVNLSAPNISSAIMDFSSAYAITLLP